MNDTPRTQQEASKRAFALAHGSRLIPDREVAEMIGGSRATVWRRVADKTLPAPVKLGGMTRWVLAEVEASIAARIAARDGEAA